MTIMRRSGSRTGVAHQVERCSAIRLGGRRSRPLPLRRNMTGLLLSHAPSRCGGRASDAESPGKCFHESSSRRTCSLSRRSGCVDEAICENRQQSLCTFSTAHGRLLLITYPVHNDRDLFSHALLLVKRNALEPAASGESLGRRETHSRLNAKDLARMAASCEEI